MFKHNEIPSAESIRNAAALPQRRKGCPALDNLCSAVEKFHGADRTDSVLQPLESAVAVCRSDDQLHSFCKGAVFKSLDAAVSEQALIAKEFVLEEDMWAISRCCRTNGWSVSFRQAGAATLAQLSGKQSADQKPIPKPHGLLEKTIKKSSLEEAYGPEHAEQILADLGKLNEDHQINIEGLVGHWGQTSDGGKILLGFCIDDPSCITDPITKETLCLPIAAASATDPAQFYLPINTTDLQALLESVAPLKLPHNAGWQGHVFGGDLDMGEAVVRGSGGPHPIVTGSEQTLVLTKLNLAIHPELRADLHSASDGTTKRTKIKHGPQFSYYAHMRNEEPGVMVDTKVMEPPPIVAMCDRGNWFILTQARRREFYEFLGLPLKSEWQTPNPIQNEQRAQRSQSRERKAAPPRRSSSGTLPPSRRTSMDSMTSLQSGPLGSETPPRRSSTSSSAIRDLPPRRPSLPQLNTSGILSAGPGPVPLAVIPQSPVARGAGWETPQEGTFSPLVVPPSFTNPFAAGPPQRAERSQSPEAGQAPTPVAGTQAPPERPASPTRARRRR